MGRLTAPSTPVHPTKHHGSAADGGTGVAIIHSINSVWAKFTRAAKKIASQKSPKSPKSPKQILLNLSNKVIIFKSKKKVSHDHGHDDDYHHEFVDDDEEGEGGGARVDFGDGGLWQRSILLGDKCQPLDFSGVIFYDHNGKQLPEFPMRSPRASPLPSYLQASSDK